MTFKLIFYYIYWSLYCRVLPWRYFQINAKHFNAVKGIYSKIDIDKLIPKKWLLAQHYATKDKLPYQFPIFVKPEWGQNANGVIKINTKQEFLSLVNKKTKIPLIMQQIATAKNEYEIFYIKNIINKNYAIFTITQVFNTSNDNNPINSINNNYTTYKDISNDFSLTELQQLKSYMQQLKTINFARVYLKTNSKNALLKGIFHIIEINLFAPLPINLLDKSFTNKNKFIKKTMHDLVLLSKQTPKKYFKSFIFLKIILNHYKVKNNL